MVQIVGFDAATILLCTGLACIAAGLIFSAPMPIQPMKAIGALAIVGAMTAGQVRVAGLTVGICILLMSLTGLIRWLSRVIPEPALRGLQMAVALQLTIKGLSLSLFVSPGHGLRPFWGPDSLTLLAAATLLILVFRRRLELVALGLIAVGFIAACFSNPDVIASAGPTLYKPSFPILDISSLSGIWLGGLAQMPLTLLNSVFAVSILAGQLFPHNRHRTTPTRISLSIGLVNLLVCTLGGMPLCHGSGGLAAQYRFGARSSLAVIIRGTALLVVGLFFGKMALAWMMAFPTSLLGVFLLLAGVGLAAASKCWRTRLGLLITAIIAVVHLSSGILILGFALGWLAHAAILRLKPEFVQLETNSV